MFSSPGGATQFGGGFLPLPSQLPDGEKLSQQEKSGNQTLRALTFAQIKKAIADHPDMPIEDLKVDGQEVTDVKSVCQVIDIQETSAYNQYRVDDTTGCLLVREWKGGQRVRKLAAAADVHLYKYVEVFGHFRMMDSTLCLMAFRIRPLTNYNLVFHHFADVIHQHLMLTKGLLEEDQQNQQNDANKPVVPMGGSMFGSTATIAATDPSMSARESMFVSELQRIYVQGGATHKPHGLHINEICAHLQGSWPKQEVDELLKKTMFDGKLYNTAPDTYQWYT